MTSPAHHADTHPSDQKVIEATQHWLQKAVIGLNLCPFAKAVHVKNQIRYRVSHATTTESLLQELIEESLLLDNADPEEIDTTLLIHPRVLDNFFDYNDFLEIADATLAKLGLEGELQIASFHPAYQFADTSIDDITNCTNRSPYPMLHLLRESSLDQAVMAFPEADKIFNKNIETMRGLGSDGWQSIVSEMFKSSPDESL